MNSPDVKRFQHGPSIADATVERLRDLPDENIRAINGVTRLQYGLKIYLSLFSKAKQWPSLRAHLAELSSDEPLTTLEDPDLQSQAESLKEPLKQILVADQKRAVDEEDEENVRKLFQLAGLYTFQGLDALQKTGHINDPAIGGASILSLRPHTNPIIKAYHNAEEGDGKVITLSQLDQLRLQVINQLRFGSREGGIAVSMLLDNYPRRMFR